MGWQTVEEKTYDEWYNFQGDYTQVVATFQTGPEQLTWMLTNPIGKWLADKVKDQALAEGATPLYFRLMKNTDPTWTTSWQIDLFAYQNSPLHLGAAAWILIAALTAVGIMYFSLQIVSEFQATRRVEIQQQTEQARIDFVQKYEPIYGEQVFDWLKDISKVPESVKQDNPALWDSLKKIFTPGIGTGLIIAGVAIVAFLLLRR